MQALEKPSSTPGSILLALTLLVAGSVAFMKPDNEFGNFLMLFGGLSALLLLRLVLIGLQWSVANIVIDIFFSIYLFILFPAIFAALLLITQATAITLLYKPKVISPKLITQQNFVPLFALFLALLLAIMWTLQIRFSFLAFGDLSNIQIGLLLVAAILVLLFFYSVQMTRAYEPLKKEMAEHERKWTLEVLALLSHNIRSPISAISQKIEILKIKLARGQNMNDADLSTLERSSDSVLDVTNKLLDSSARTIIGQTQGLRFSLNVTLEKVSGDAIIDNPDLLDFEMPSTASISLQICLDSLLSNARKYWIGKPIISVRKDKKNWEISVIDHGSGMTEEQKKTYGQPFNVKHSSGGTGLGVYITLQIIKELGWDWRLSSTLNAGTSVSIIIPEHLVY